MRLWRRGLREFSVWKGFGLEGVFTVVCLFFFSFFSFSFFLLLLFVLFLFCFCGALRPHKKQQHHKAY